MHQYNGTEIKPQKGFLKYDVKKQTNDRQAEQMTDKLNKCRWNQQNKKQHIYYY